MNYIARFNMEYNPFIKNENKYTFKSKAYNEVEFRLNNLLNIKGFGVITGSPGRGKTTIIRSYLKTLNSNSYKIIYTSLSNLTLNEFYRHLAECLGLEPHQKRSVNFRNIQSEINRYAVEKRITPMIIIDEANYMNNSVLNDLKMLFNFDMDSKDKAIMILVGLPSLNNLINLSANEPFRQRIITNYNIDSLNRIESKEYIEEKLIAAGSSTNIFNDNALETIISCASGIPRMIDRYCDKCLLIANIRELNVIDSDVVLDVTNEIELG